MRWRAVEIFKANILVVQQMIGTLLTYYFVMEQFASENQQHCGAGNNLVANASMTSVANATQFAWTDGTVPNHRISDFSFLHDFVVLSLLDKENLTHKKIRLSCAFQGNQGNSVPCRPPWFFWITSAFRILWNQLCFLLANWNCKKSFYFLSRNQTGVSNACMLVDHISNFNPMSWFKINKKRTASFFGQEINFRRLPAEKRIEFVVEVRVQLITLHRNGKHGTSVHCAHLFCTAFCNHSFGV